MPCVVGAVGPVVTLRVPAHLDRLAEVRAFVGEAAQRAGLTAAATYDLQLAVDEAVTNIILHGYKGGEGSVELAVEQLADSLELHILDRAPLFDPTTYRSPDTEIPWPERERGGLGVHLVFQGVDAVRHTPREPEGNELTLVKRLTC